MPDYKAPVEVYQFLLAQVVGLSKLSRYPRFAEASDELAEAVIAEAARLAEEEMAPLNPVGDQHGVTLDDRAVTAAPGFAAAYEAYREGGWLGLAVDEVHGGQGLPFVLHMAVSEFWNSANLSFALCPMLSMGAIEAVIAHGDPELQATYLEPLVSGRWTGTMNLTEPQAGSDLSTVRTRAVPDGDSYRISGQKIYISWGDHDMADNILHLVLARLPDAPEGTRGLSLFLVPKFIPDAEGQPGVRNPVWPISCEEKLGIHASPTCVMQYGEESGQGALGYLVGEPNSGLACMFTMMNHARLEVGLEGVGLAERAYQAARAYAVERRQGSAPGSEGSSPIIAHADVRRMLLTMRSLTEAGRMLSLVAAAELDHCHGSDDEAVVAHHRARLELLTPVVKAWCTEMAQEVTSLGIQVFGGMGYVEETGVAQFFRDARITTIYEGTSGIQALDLVGRKFLRDQGTAMAGLQAEVHELIDTMQNSGDDRAGDLAQRLKSALDMHASSCETIQRRAGDDGRYAGAVAFDFMMLTGTLIGGWLHAKSYVAASAAGGSADTNLRARLQTGAAFYIEQILPRMGAHAAAIAAPLDLLDAKEDWV